MDDERTIRSVPLPWRVSVARQEAGPRTKGAVKTRI